MKIAICAAGTGGHIYPGIAVAKSILNDGPGSSVMFFCSGRKIESEIFSGEKFIVRQASFFRSLISFAFSRPDVLLSMGGASGLPVILAAKLLFIPVVLHEQNVLPGKANRLAGRLAKKVAVSFEGTKTYLKGPAAEVTGNPVRQEILDAQRDRSRAKMNIREGSFTVLVVGGSQGAVTVNKAVVEMLSFISGKGMTVIHICGSKDLEAAKGRSGSVNSSGTDYRLFPYLHDVSAALASSDLVVSRAGATALSEIAAKGLPSILIPYPYAAEDHQTLNAQVFGERGASVILKDGSLSGEALSDIIISLMNDRGALKRMSVNAASLSRPGASEDLKRLVYEAI